MLEVNETPTIFSIDTGNQSQILGIEKTKAWNPQQGTMFYCNATASTQVFFNEDNAETLNVFTVLYEVLQRRRVCEFRNPDASIGNAGDAVYGAA